MLTAITKFSLICKLLHKENANCSVRIFSIIKAMRSTLNLSLKGQDEISKRITYPTKRAFFSIANKLEFLKNSKIMWRKT